MSDWKKVFATHMQAQILATGMWPGDYYPGVALPSEKSLGKWVELRFHDKWTIARVMDVGPWCEDDEAYVFGNARPRAETFKGDHVRIKDGGDLHTLTSNGAGIDLFPGTASSLEITRNDNVQLEWRFIEPGEKA